MRTRRQTRIIASANPDVVALQEVSPTRCASLTHALAHNGLTHTHTGQPVGHNHPFLMFLASRWPITPRTPHGIDVPRTDRVQVIAIHAPNGDFDVFANAGISDHAPLTVALTRRNGAAHDASHAATHAAPRIAPVDAPHAANPCPSRPCAPI